MASAVKALPPSLPSSARNHRQVRSRTDCRSAASRSPRGRTGSCRVNLAGKDPHRRAGLAGTLQRRRSRAIATGAGGGAQEPHVERSPASGRPAREAEAEQEPASGRRVRWRRRNHHRSRGAAAGLATGTGAATATGAGGIGPIFLSATLPQRGERRSHSAGRPCRCRNGKRRTGAEPFQVTSLRTQPPALFPLEDDPHEGLPRIDQNGVDLRRGELLDECRIEIG